MELQEIKKGVDTRIGNRNESGRDKKKTDTVFFLLSGRDKCLGVRKTALKYWPGLFGGRFFGFFVFLATYR